MLVTRIILLCICAQSYASHIIEESFYGKLGTHLGVQETQLNKIFRQKALAFHPDKNKNSQATAQFQILQQMCTTLKDPPLRKEYDIKLAQNLQESDSLFAQLIGYEIYETYNDSYSFIDILRICFPCIESHLE
jgi:DnaJ-class molecular chaperone